MSRVGDEWLSLMGESSGRAICGAFGLPYPIDPESDDFAASLALVDLGLCEAKIVAEPRLRRSRDKALRDAELGRDTIHLAPTWRYAAEDDVPVPALIMPVEAEDHYCRAMALWRFANAEEFAGAIVDLVAIPLDGSRPLSMSGHTLAIGSFAVEAEKLVVQANGLSWLKAYVAKVRQITGETPAHLVPKLHFPLPPPDDVVTLLVEPFALDWRVTSMGCVIPHAAREVVVPDSRRLAEAIDGLMRKKERARPLPIVRGPKEAAA